MKHLKIFETAALFESARATLDLPNVSLVEATMGVNYLPYVQPIPVETRLVCKYDSTYEDEEIRLLSYDVDLASFSAMEIDDVVQPSVVSSYTFSTIGEHTVKYTLTDPTTIEESAFDSCTSLTSCTIGGSVTNISDRAFQGCYGLTNIVIPSNVTNLGELTFYNCGNLESFTVMATTPPSMNSIFGGEMSDPTIYVPSASVETYKAAEGWSDYASNIEPIS